MTFLITIWLESFWRLFIAAKIIFFKAKCCKQSWEGLTLRTIDSFKYTNHDRPVVLQFFINEKYTHMISQVPMLQTHKTCINNIKLSFLIVIVKLEVHVVSMRSIQVHSSPFRSIHVHSVSFILLHGHGADTIINSCHHHRKLFRGLEMSYIQVWYTIGTVSWSPTQFHTEIIGLIRVNFQ